MTGFTLYETLRIFVPGALAVLLTDFVLRLAVGPNPAVGDGDVGQLVVTLETVGVALGVSELAPVSWTRSS